MRSDTMKITSEEDMIERSTIAPSPYLQRWIRQSFDRIRRAVHRIRSCIGDGVGSRVWGSPRPVRKPWSTIDIVVCRRTVDPWNKIYRIPSHDWNKN